jgi:hypothetical protein
VLPRSPGATHTTAAPPAAEEALDEGVHLSRIRRGACEHACLYSPGRRDNERVIRHPAYVASLALALAILADGGMPTPAEAAQQSARPDAAHIVIRKQLPGGSSYPDHADYRHIDAPDIPVPRARPWGSFTPGLAVPGAAIPGSPGMLVLEQSAN